VLGASGRPAVIAVQAAGSGVFRRLLKELLELEGQPHITLDLQLATHHGHHRVQFAFAQLIDVFQFGNNGAIGLAAVLVNHRFIARTINGDAAFGELKLDGFAKRLHAVNMGTEAFGKLADFHSYGSKSALRTAASKGKVSSAQISPFWGFSALQLGSGAGNGFKNPYFCFFPENHRVCATVGIGNFAPISTQAQPSNLLTPCKLASKPLLPLTTR